MTKDRTKAHEQLVTTPPPFDPEEFARESESMTASPAVTHSMKPTSPPEPFYTELRESCSDQMLAAKALGDADDAPDSADFQSEVRVLSSAPLPPELSLDEVPVVAMHADDMAWFELDDGAKRFLTLVDGVASVGVIVTRSPLSPDESIQLLRELLHVGVIGLR